MGLIDWGSVPLHILCLTGLFTFLALWALAYAVEHSATNGKENHMKTEKTITSRLNLIASSLATTIWATWKSIWLGALSG